MGSSSAGVLAAALAAGLIGGCSREGPPGPPPPSEQLPPPVAPPSAAPLTSRPNAESNLASASLVALSLAPGLAGSEGLFAASIAVPGEPGTKEATLALALRTAPRSLDRPLAFYRVAGALGIGIVPPAAEIHLGLGELGDLLARDPAASSLVRSLAAVQNDGTVDALLTAWPAPRAASSGERAAVRELGVTGSYEVETWARWSTVPDPAPGEQAGFVRGYVEMLVLDYLTGDVTRRSLFADDAAGALVLVDNSGAFPQHVERSTRDRILRRLRVVARFSRGLHDALLAFDRERAAAVLAPGGFETWLVSPRARIELEERRLGLLTLLDAKIAERGGSAVLCL
jgi:hypothetical protein